MSRLKAYKVDALIVAGFLILPLLLFGTVTLGSRTMLPADNLFQWQPWFAAADSFDVPYPHNGLLSDLILENYAWKQFIRQAVQERQIPLWNPHIFAGTPFLATGQHSAYYPFSLTFLILPLDKAYGWYTISQLWLAGVFTYFFGRVLGLRRSSAALAGLVFQGCGFLLVSSAVFPMILGAAIWLPLLLASLEMVIRHSSSPEGSGRTLPWAALGAIALGAQTLAGHIEITYYTLLVMAFYAAWRLLTRFYQLWRQPRLEAASNRPYSSLLRPAAWLMGLVLIGLMLGAIQFIPFLEVGQANFREGSATLAQIRGWAFPLRRLLTFVAPDFFGNPADHSYFDVFSGRQVAFATNLYGQLNPHGPYSSSWGIKNYVEGGVYLGILPLILAILGVWSARRQRPDRRSEVGFFAILGLLSVAFIFGTPLYAILYYALPGINQLHSPFRWVFPLSLSVAFLAGYGADYLLNGSGTATGLDQDAERPAGGRGRSFLTLGAEPLMGALLGGLAFWAGAGLVAVLLLSRVLYARLEPAIERLFLGLEQAADAFPNTSAFYSYEFEQLLIFGLMLLLAGLVLRASQGRLTVRGRPVWPLMAAGLIVLDLFIAGYGFNSAAEPALLNYEPELLQWLDDQPGLWRLTTFAPHGEKPLNANTPWLYGLQDVRGYDSVILKQYTDYMAAIEPQNELQFNRVQPIVNWQSLNSPLLDLLGVKYVVSADAIELPKLKEVWSGEGLVVYENLAAVPRAYTIPAAATLVAEDALGASATYDPRQYVIVEAQDWSDEVSGPATPQELVPAEVTAYESIEVKVQAAVDQPSWLVLNDTYFQGWDAYVRSLDQPANGTEEEVALIRVNGNFRGVLLQPGQWEVRFRYSPLSFKLGGLTTFMGGIIIIFGLGVWAWRRFYNPQGPLTNTRSIAKNSLAPMTLNLFNRAIDFAFAAFYLRILGPADAGKYATAIIIAGWFEIISNFGLNTLVIREVSKDKGQASRYLLNTTILRIGTGLVGSLPIFVYLLGIRLAGNPMDPATSAAILLLMVGMVFSGMSQGLGGLYYAYEMAEIPAAITTVTTILKVAFGVIVLLLGYSFVGLAAVSILVNIVTLAILSASTARQFKFAGPWRVDFGLQRRMLSLSYPLMLNHLFAVIFFQIDVPLMRQINGDTVVGWYNSAYKWVNAFNVIPSFFTIALFPVITRQATSALSDARRTFRMSLKAMVLLAFPLAAVTTILAPIMIGVLGGREFLPHGALALQLVIWSIPIGWMNSVTNYVLVALGREKRLTIAFVIGVLFNLVANLIFLPRYSYVAASIITILSEIVLLALFAFYLRPAMPDVHWLKIIKRPLAATAVMLWAMVAGNLIGPLVSLILGVAAYLVAIWLLRIFGDEERRILLSILPQRVAVRLAFLQPRVGE
ncbi:MAG: oligosaccharide flippase family protein [Candidatus Promineifilaceae bacterium]